MTTNVIPLTKEQIVQACHALQEITTINGAGSQERIATHIRINDTPAFRYLLDVAFNPFYVTHIKTIKIVPEEYFKSDLSFVELVDLCISQKALSDYIRSQIHEHINSYTEVAVREIMSKILTKTLNVGIGVKGINSALGEKFLVDMSVMLASDKYDKFLKTHEVFNAEEKYDGVRVITILGEKNVFYTRNFLTIDSNSLNNINRQLRTLETMMMSGCGVAETSALFVDGELIAKNRTTISGKVNSILKGKGVPNMDSEWTYILFDVEKQSTLVTGKGSKSFEQRRAMLEKAFMLAEKSGMEMPNLLLSESYLCTSENDIQIAYQSIIEKGGEGLILKAPNHLYQCKRSNDWTKMKEENDCDLQIVGWFEGKKGTKRESSIGGFVCQSKDGGLQVSVGSGFSDEFLDEIMTNDPNSYLGKICTVRYNVKILAKNTLTYSLFLPRFVAIREDKFHADILSEIK